MVETCILPILLHGAENWCLSQNSIQTLDSFLGELSKRLLKLPRWYSNTPASIVIGLGSARALCLTRKLNFLRKISSDDHSETVSSLTLASLSDDIDSVCLIRECRDLEQHFHSNFTAAILHVPFLRIRHIYVMQCCLTSYIFLCVKVTRPLCCSPVGLSTLC